MTPYLVAFWHKAGAVDDYQGPRWSSSIDLPRGQQRSSVAIMAETADTAWEMLRERFNLIDKDMISVQHVPDDWTPKKRGMPCQPGAVWPYPSGNFSRLTISLGEVTAKAGKIAAKQKSGTKAVLEVADALRPFSALSDAFYGSGAKENRVVFAGVTEGGELVAITVGDLRRAEWVLKGLGV